MTTAVSVICPTPTREPYRPLLDTLHVTGGEEPQVLSLLGRLDGLDGICDGKLSPVKYDELKSAWEKVAALDLSPRRRAELQYAVTRHLMEDDFSAFISRPYHEVLQFLLRNPIFADVVIPHIQPRGFWSDGLATMALKIQDCQQDAPEVYPKMVDALYDRSGLDHLNTLLDKAERARLREASTPNDVETLFNVEKAKNPGASIRKLMGFLELPELPDWGRVTPALIPALKAQKDRAETELVSTLLEKVDTFPAVMKRDPLTYWMPLVKLATSEPDLAEKTVTHYNILRSLYAKARTLAYDDVMGILFDVEYAEYTGDPMDIANLNQKMGDIRDKISEINQTQYILPNGLAESGTERLGRYYSTIGHLLTRKYAAAISPMTPNVAQIAQIEADVEALLQERRDKTTVDEALVYADTVNIIASAWATEGGMMTQKLMVHGLPAANEALTRLVTFHKRFETLCNGHYLDPNGGEQLREKMADIRWKVFGEAFFRAGQPLQGLTNLDIEPQKFQSTRTYAAHVRGLGNKYPWLVDKNGGISLGEAGDHGKKAESITAALFYSSRETGREIGLPVIGAVAGSLGGPLGTIAGGYAGKGINRLVNSTSDDARVILSQARATGIPLISEGLSEQLSHAENIDLAICGASSLLMFRFYRSALSLTRAASQASYRFVMRGGLQSTARTSVNHLTFTHLKAAGRGLSARTVGGVKNIPSEVRAIPGKVVDTYGRSGVWPTMKHVWNQYGVRMRLATSAALLAGDYLPDRKFNTWAGPLGASLLINDAYGKVVWGWNGNAGMVGFVWRYGVELGVQAMQGIPLSRPRMDYTVAGMLASYTLRGFNKLYTLGRAETHSSPILQRLAHFVEEHDVLVPRSVAGLTRIKAKWGMVRGVVMRIGKPAKTLSANLPDGTILRVEEIQKNGSTYVVRVVRKMTAKSGKPVEVVTESMSEHSVPFEEIKEILVPRASWLGRQLSRTVHVRLADAGIYRVPNAVMKFFGIQPKKWVELGQRVGTADKPIFNFRGSLANAGDLPVLALVGGGFGLLQDSDPQMTGLYRAADYGISFFFQHKIQHLLKIDGVVSAAVGYALGLPFSILSLPSIFPTVINQAPNLTKKGKGYFDRLAAGDDEGATAALQSAVTSLCPVSKVPGFGPHVWNEVTPFGAVKDSYHRIEEVGAVTYWRRMIEKLDEGKVMEYFIDKVAHDSQRYLVDRDLPEDPVRLRLLALELAFVKRLMQDKTHPELMRHASRYAVLRAVTPQIPLIRTESDLKQMITGLNINKKIN